MSIYYICDSCIESKLIFLKLLIGIQLAYISILVIHSQAGNANMILIIT